MTVRTSLGPLPSIEHPDSFVAEVQRRIQDLHEQVQGAQDSISTEARTREAEVKQLKAEMDTRAQEIEQLSRTVAVGGLVEQIYGWMFISAGVALGTFGNVLQAAQSS